MSPETINCLYKLTAFLNDRKELFERLIIRDQEIPNLESRYKGSRDEILILLKEIRNILEGD